MLLLTEQSWSLRQLQFLLLKLLAEPMTMCGLGDRFSECVSQALDGRPARG